MIVVCQENFREGKWNLMPIALLCYLILGLIKRRERIRIVSRLVCALASITICLLWIPVTAIGIQSGPYQFSETDFILFSLVAIPIGSFFATFTMLGSTKVCDYFKEQ